MPILGSSDSTSCLTSRYGRDRYPEKPWDVVLREQRFRSSAVSLESFVLCSQYGLRQSYGYFSVSLILFGDSIPQNRRARVNDLKTL